MISGDIIKIAKVIASYPRLLETGLRHDIVLSFEWKVAWYLTYDIPVNTHLEWVEMTVPRTVLKEFPDEKLTISEFMQRSSFENAGGPTRL